MNEYSTYALSLIVFTLFIQWLVASGAKAKRAGAVPGKEDRDWGPDEFAFRAHRTFMNSLENMPFLLGSVLVSYFAGANQFFISVCLWIYAAARIVYTLWYYNVATERNPSGRTGIFMMGMLANLVLLIGAITSI